MRMRTQRKSTLKVESAMKSINTSKFLQLPQDGYFPFPSPKGQQPWALIIAQRYQPDAHFRNNGDAQIFCNVFTNV